MRCPRCGAVAKVVDTMITEDNERHRRHRCKTCGKTFYSIEFIIDYDEKVCEAWRDKNSSRTRKKKGE